MNGAEFQARRGYRLDPPGHPQGVSCDAQGPAWGPIRLLAKTAAGFEPRPVEELNDLLGRTFGRPVDCAGLRSELWAAARALNEGDLARAMIATQYLRLPYLDAEQARRAAAAVAITKAAPDDPKHPGWPAGEPDGRGGQFRPKDKSRDEIEDRLERLIARREIRAALRGILTGRRLLRLAGETASNLVPGLDVVGDVAMAVDLAQMAKEFATLKRDAEAAQDFVKKGPHKLEELRVGLEDEAFRSFNAFKKVDLIKRFGPAGDGYEYHHIVEQAGDGDVSAGELHSTRNIIRIPKLLHEEINSRYGRSDGATGTSLRGKLKGRPFEERWREGLNVMLEIGIIE